MKLMERKLPIVIGAFEAQSIAIALEKKLSPRPLTHDLFKILQNDLTSHKAGDHS
jgi:bifunctional DNase/RNase